MNLFMEIQKPYAKHCPAPRGRQRHALEIGRRVAELVRDRGGKWVTVGRSEVPSSPGQGRQVAEEEQPPREGRVHHVRRPAQKKAVNRLA